MSELLLKLNAETSGSPAANVPPLTQWVPWECVCGKRCGAYLRHYQLVSCGGCQAMWWALQPKRGGRLVAFAWPGFPVAL